MKKLVLAIAALGLVSLTSCKKEYTCSCTTFSNAPGFTATTVEGKTDKMKKSDAKTKCEAGSSSTTAGGYTSGAKCEIK